MTATTPSPTPIQQQAREHLASAGWVQSKNESFRHLPPPPAHTWTGSEHAARNGWTVSALNGGNTDAAQVRLLSATQSSDWSALFAGLAAPGTDDAAPFAWAHRALCTHALHLRVHGGSAQEPVCLDLQHLLATGVDAPLLVIELAQGSHCLLREWHAAPADGGAPATQNLQVHIQLASGAQLQHLRVSAPRAQDQLAHVVTARVADGARYAQAVVAHASGYHLQRSQVLLEGAAAAAHVAGLAFVPGAQFEQQISMRHQGRQSQSHSAALVLGSGKGHAVANATTTIAAGADGADVHQHLAGIPIAGQPRLVLRPHLEIYHDNVQAAHGATWGALPEDALFYARQRGLDEAAARALIIGGMAQALLARAFPDASALACLTDGAAFNQLLQNAVGAHHG